MQRLSFQAADLTIGNDEEVPTAACGVHEPQLAEFVMKALDGGTGCCRLQLRFKIIEEQGTYRPENVLLSRVMGTKLTAFPGSHDVLEHRTEDGGREYRRVETASVE